MTPVLVAAGGAVGAVLRWAVATVGVRTAARLPWGTLAVNLVGSLVLGYLAGRLATGGLGSDGFAALATGGLGGLTTFSTFAVEAERLADDAPGLGVGYMGVTLAGCIAAAAAGWAVSPG